MVADVDILQERKCIAQTQGFVVRLFKFSRQMTGVPMKIVSQAEVKGELFIEYLMPQRQAQAMTAIGKLTGLGFTVVTGYFIHIGKIGIIYS